MERSTLWQFLGGIAIFLYALDVIEEVAKSGGAKMQQWIESMTSTKTRSMILWASLVNILQSSHAVSLIILALVGWGMIALNHAIAVIIGMNVWSVFMEALIGLFGLWFNMKVIVMPMVAIGWLGAFFSKQYRKWFLILLSLWLVFLWLEYMKDSIKFLRASIDLSQYTQFHRWWFIIIGLIGTVMTQSSSAMTIIVMTALLEKILPFDGACATLMGAYIGSSTTALFVAYAGGSSIKKQVAMSHFLFNILTTLIFVMIFPLIINLITDVWWFGGDAEWFAWLKRTNVNGLIIFFLLFKALGWLIHIPFIDAFARILERIIPNNQKEQLWIENMDITVNKQTKAQVLLHDIDNLYDQHREIISSWFADPTTYSEDVYYAQKEKFDKLFQFAVQHQDNPKLVDRLQETMQALKLCKDTMKSFVKVHDLADEATNLYLGELHTQIDAIMILIQKGEFKSASDATNVLASRDEIKMQELTHSGKSVSESIIELIQIHDHIHGSLRSLIESRI